MKDYIDYILKKGKKPVEIEEIYRKVEEKRQKENPEYSLSDSDIEEIDKILSKGIENYEYYKTPHGRFTLLSSTSFRKGKFRGNRIGGGIVVSNTTYLKKDGSRVTKEEKFTIDRDNCNNAVDGDVVLIDTGGNGNKPCVVNVISRNIGNIVGEVTKIGTRTYVKPIDKKKQLLTIHLKDEIEDGSIVSVSLSELGEEDLKLLKDTPDNHYIGKISHVFLHNDGPYHNALLEAFKTGMPEGFSEASLRQAENIPDMVSDKDKSLRYDFTKWNIFSIDCEDTKDKDDAISLDILPNGNYLLGVHIADVVYYVKEGTPIDKDAFRKGTSYYFGGCVEPQLPQKLSNGICSLNEGVDRLTKTILIEFDKDGNVVSRSLVPSVIKSRKSMSYDKVNRLLRGEKIEDYLPYKETLRRMNDLTYILRKKRILDGAIIFNRPEIRFNHDEMGNPTEVALRFGDTAERIIEEFMLAANNNVAEILTEANIPCVYRIHDVPNCERLEEFLRLLEAINMPFDVEASDIIDNKETLQLLALHINRNNSFAPMLNTNLIKCMSHASYNTKNIGHFGIGSSTYCHFTSPIRRIADLAISRIIDECYFEKNPSLKDKNIKKWIDLANDYASQASLMERLEEDVEKNVLYMDTAAYLSNYIGQEFEGTVVTLSNNGICVQLDNQLEGRVRNRYLDGVYAYNPQTFTLVSVNSKGNYYVGDKLRLKLIDTSIETKSVDFVVLEKIKENTIKDKRKSNQYVKSKAQDDKNRRPYI